MVSCGVFGVDTGYRTHHMRYGLFDPGYGVNDKGFGLFW